MKTIAIVEDDRKDFDSVKRMFEESNVLPQSYADFWKMVDTKNEEAVVSYIYNWLIREITNNTICGIIMDIALLGDEDETGIKIIEKIRENQDPKCKLIPVFCYSKYGEDGEKRKRALKNGATAVFVKEDIENTGINARQNIVEFQIHLKTQMLAYDMACYGLNVMQKVDDKLSSIHDFNENHTKKLDLAIEMVLTMMKLNDLNLITDDTEKEQTIKEIVGGEDQLEQMRKKMYQIEDKYNQVEILNDISDVLSSIPGLNFVFPIVTKLLSMIRKNAD